MRKARGFTIMLTFGRWGGLSFYFSSHSWRLCLGFVALTLVFADFEIEIGNLIEAHDQQIKELSNHSPNTGN